MGSEIPELANHFFSKSFFDHGNVDLGLVGQQVLEALTRLEVHFEVFQVIALGEVLIIGFGE